jgi:hypothetical protein
MGVSDKGEPVEPRAEGAASEALRLCFVDALRALTFDGPIKKNAKIVVTALVRSARDETSLPEMQGHEKLVVLDDASCEGMTIEPCPPHKDCVAPTRRKVRCPETYGLPPRINLHEADRRVHLGVSGGKPGQPGEEVIVAEGKDQCLLVVRSSTGENDVSPELPGEPEIQVDVPCARAKAVWAAVTKHRLASHTKPKGTPSQTHGLGRRWQLVTRGPDDIPIVASGSWIGDDALGNAAFDAVGGAIAKLAGGAGLTLRRFGD